MPTRVPLLLIPVLFATGLLAWPFSTRADNGPAAVQSIAEANARSQHTRERGIPYAKLVRGNPERKVVALTFDDGPHGPATERLLDILRKENVKATFFLVGKMVEKHLDLVQQEAAEGHEIANHTYSHTRLLGLTPDRVESELRDGAQVIDKAVGSRPRLFRPPGGEYDNETIEAAKRLGYVMVLWTDDPSDYQRISPDLIESRILKHVRNGSIVLLHDGIPETLEMLPDLIAKLRQQGYKFVTISEMALEPGAVITGGPRVRPGFVRGKQVTTPPQINALAPVGVQPLTISAAESRKASAIQAGLRGPVQAPIRPSFGIPRGGKR